MSEKGILAIDLVTHRNGQCTTQPRFRPLDPSWPTSLGMTLGCIGSSEAQVLPGCCCVPYLSRSLLLSPSTRSGELRTQKLNSHLMRTQSLNVLPLKPGVGQDIAMHATLTAGDLFLANFYPSGPFTCIFKKNKKTLPSFSFVSCD